MKDKYKTKEQLIKELAELRKRLSDLQTSDDLQLFKNLINQTNDALFVIDSETSKFLYINDKTCNNLGYTRAEMLDMGVTDIEAILPDNFSWSKYVSEVREKGYMLLEGLHKRKDGTTFPVWVNVKFLTIGENNYIVATVRDITEWNRLKNELGRLNKELEQRVIERTAQLKAVNKQLKDEIAAHKLAEEKILKEKNFTQAVIDSLSATFFIFDSTGKMLQWNKTAESVTGYSPDEIARMEPLDFITEEDRGLVQKRIEEVFVKGTAGVEANYLTKAGEKIPYYFTGVRIMIDNVLGLVGIGIDISDRKRTEEALKKSEAYYRSLVETSPYSIVVADLTGRITFCNRQTLYMHGFKGMEEIIGTSCFDLFAPECRQRAADATQQSLINGGFRNVEYTLIRKDGSRFPAETSASLIVDKEGKTQGFVGVLWDVTERRKMEEELEKIRRIESIGVLAGGIAHDFNNVLTIIMGSIFIAKRELSKPHPPDNNKILKMLTDSEEGCKNARDLSNMLITFSRGEMPMRKLISISEILKKTTSLLLSNSKNITCEFSLPDNLYVMADKFQINQVIKGIVANAIEAMPDGGIIRMMAESITISEGNNQLLKDGKYLRVSIEDTGIGISQENLSKIFDLYFSTKDKYSQKGMGLGLSICYSVIKKHGGLITIDSKVGAGTTFHIYLPAP